MQVGQFSVDEHCYGFTVLGDSSQVLVVDVAELVVFNKSDENVEG